MPLVAKKCAPCSRLRVGLNGLGQVRSVALGQMMQGQCRTHAVGRACPAYQTSCANLLPERRQLQV
jgi:hypothetical protein